MSMLTLGVPGNLTQKYNLPRPVATPVDSPLAAMGGTSPTSLDTAAVYSPSHPLFWIGGAVAVLFGLVYVSAETRVGPVKAGGSVGKP